MGEDIVVDEGETPYPVVPLLRALLKYGNIVPTLTGWAIIIFVALLCSVGGWFIWRRIM